MEDFTKNQRKEFKVGDRVYASHFGEGIIVGIDESKSVNNIFPIIVEWTKKVQPYHQNHDCFTLDGQYAVRRHDSDLDIELMEEKPKEEKPKEEKPNLVDRMMDAIHKKTEDAINPSHYKVKGLSEAHEIINHLMHREQYEGFLWGNIIKYAYRYGRKGDKAETAGKIEWYAKKLKELEECEGK